MSLEIDPITFLQWFSAEIVNFVYLTFNYWH